MVSDAPRRILRPLSPGGRRNFLDTLRGETIGGVLLLVAAAVAIGWANSPWADGYFALQHLQLGPESLGLHLSVGAWASDGLLAVFFLVVGLELKREIVAGELRRFSTAIVPVIAAVGGMAAPALIYLAVNLTQPDGAVEGWAIPTATDIAFAVAVLAVVGRHLPISLRAFLLTLAVVDDLLAIVIIAVAYTASLQLVWLACAGFAVAVFALLVRRGITRWWLLIPLGILAWGFMHSSGIHATIAGVALGMVVPAVESGNAGESSMAARFEHLWRPVSAGFAVPVFALFAAGVTIDGANVLGAFQDPIAQGIALGLLIGKPIGIFGATWLLTRFTRASLSSSLRWPDIASIGLLGGVGFTVSLLVGHLAFLDGSAQAEHVRMGVLSASTLAALLGGGLLYWRGMIHHARRNAKVDETSR